VIDGDSADRRLSELAPDRFPVAQPVQLDQNALTIDGLAVHTYAGALNADALRHLVRAADDPTIGDSEGHT
jgi:hypothetical protein